MDLNLPKARTVKKNAGFFKRLLALVLDLLILNFVIFSSFEKIFLKYIDTNLSTVELITYFQSAETSVLVTTIFFMALLSLFYFTLFELKIGQTLGMMILKIRVEGELSFWKCALRNIFVFPFFPFYILWIVDPIHLAIRGTRFTELITKTNTVEEIHI